jgi:hypothetical protein
MKTPKKNTVKKSASVAKNKSALNQTPPVANPDFIADEDDDVEIPLNDLELDELDTFDDEDDF